MSSQDPLALTFNGPHKVWWYVGTAVVVIFAFLIDSGSDNNSLKVLYENNLLKIQNVGVKPVHLQDIVINDRKDCRFVNATPLGNILNVGDSILLVSECEAVRVTITTDDGPRTYGISR